MSRKLDLTGQRFNRLKVIRELEKAMAPCGQSLRLWECVCDCGNKTKALQMNLRTGHTKSCGCLNKERVIFSKTKHGMAKTPEHRAWMSMKNRCNNKNNKAYHHYGGRGIFVCERWSGSFLNFLEDMGMRPSPEHSIDRYPDNDGPYSPENCRWATDVEQLNNTRRNRFIEIDGVSLTLAQWGKRLGIKSKVIRDRIAYGWDEKRAVTTPLDLKQSAISKAGASK